MTLIGKLTIAELLLTRRPDVLDADRGGRSTEPRCRGSRPAPPLTLKDALALIERANEAGDVKADLYETIDRRSSAQDIAEVVGYRARGLH